VGQNGNSECVGTVVRTDGWLQSWYCSAYRWLAAVLVLLCVQMVGCMCWYCSAYRWLAAVLVLLCVQMVGCSLVLPAFQ
jgi:hypothetical protein